MVSPKIPSQAIEVVREGAGKNIEIKNKNDSIAKGELKFIGEDGVEGSKATINRRAQLKSLMTNEQLLADECLQDENGLCAKANCTCI